MLKDEAGKKLPIARWGRYDERGETRRDAIHILVVDPVLGSRFSLVQALSHTGVVVDAAASIEDAHLLLARQCFALIISDHDLADGRGLDFLADLRASHPEVPRALVSGETGLEFKRTAIERAGLCFLLSKPWSPEALRRTIRELLGGDSEFAGWERRSSRIDRSPAREDRRSNLLDSTRHQEVLLRGLLAGLNSCEGESEVFELFHAELVETFQITQWLWIHEDSGLATRVVGDWPAEEGIRLDTLSEAESHYLVQSRRSVRATRIDEEHRSFREDADRGACLSMAIRISGVRALTCLVWLDRAFAPALVSLLRELQVGLEMAFQRIREAESRAEAARTLARRVSEELRTPVGALTHAIDRLRGEAERAGLSTEWVDRISSESERVVRAVEHLEGEMFVAPARSTSTLS